MSTRFVRILALAVGLVALLAPTAAHAADNYADPGVQVATSVDSCDDGPVRFSGSASYPGTWSVTFDGTTTTLKGSSVETTFPVDYGSAPGRIAPGETASLSIVFTYDNNGTTSSARSSSAVAVPVCGEGAGTVGSGTGAVSGGLAAVLPNTGGPTLWLGLGGLLAIVLGLVAVRRSRQH